MKDTTTLFKHIKKLCLEKVTLFNHYELICTTGERDVFIADINKELNDIQHNKFTTVSHSRRYYKSLMTNGDFRMRVFNLFDFYHSIVKNKYVYAYSYFGDKFTQKDHVVISLGDNDDINKVDAVSEIQLLDIIEQYTMRKENIILTNRAYKYYVLLLLNAYNKNVSLVYSRLYIRFCTDTVTLDDIDLEILNKTSNKLIFI